MIGMLIGLLASLAVTQVLVSAEGQKRSTISGSDAQINGALAMNALQRALAPAGYGFSNNPTSIGCPIAAQVNGAAYTAFPAQLAPVIITQGGSGAPDSVRVLASAKSSYSLPIRIVSPGYNPGLVATSSSFPVANIRGIAGPVTDPGGTVLTPGDLMLAVIDSTTACQVFEVTATPSVDVAVPRTDTNKWNGTGFPSTTYGNGNFLVNLGSFSDNTYSVSGSNTLQVSRFVRAADSTPSYETVELFTNIVNLRAMYGKDTNADGVIDAWDNTTPTTNAGWLQVLAVRIAVVSRSDQYEKDEVTASNPEWDVGTAVTITGTTTCGASKCLSLKVDGLTDWKHYRYKVFDTVVPLRNMLWTA